MFLVDDSIEKRVGFSLTTPLSSKSKNFDLVVWRESLTELDV